MKKVFTLLIFSFMCISLSNASQLNPDPLIHDIIERSKYSVVRINTYNRYGEPLMRGSGFFLSPGEILTCEHVIEDAYSAEVVSDFYNYKNVTIFKVDEENDLVLLCINSTGEEGYLNLEKEEEVQCGQTVITIGYPGSASKMAFNGIVVEGKDEGPLSYESPNQLSITISGMSGGPVLNLKGNVVGIIRADHSAVSVKTLKKFLNNPDNPKQLHFAGYCVLWMRILQGTIDVAKEVPSAILEITIEPIFNHGWVKGVVIIILVASLTVWSAKRFPEVSEAHRKRKSKKEIIK